MQIMSSLTLLEGGGVKILSVFKQKTTKSNKIAHIKDNDTFKEGTITEWYFNFRNIVIVGTQGWCFINLGHILLSE